MHRLRKSLWDHKIIENMLLVDLKVNTINANVAIVTVLRWYLLQMTSSWLRVWGSKKGYSSQRFIKNRNFDKKLNMQRTWQLAFRHWQILDCGKSSRQWVTRTSDNVAIVEECEYKLQTQCTIRETARETGIHRSSIYRLIGKNLALKCIKKKPVQNLTKVNKKACDYLLARTWRSSDKLLLTVPRIALSVKAFSVSAPSVWNSLSYNCRSAQLLSTFKHSLITELFDIAIVNMNTQPSLCHYAPLIHSRHMALYKCALIVW